MLPDLFILITPSLFTSINQKQLSWTETLQNSNVFVYSVVDVVCPTGGAVEK